MIKIVTHNSNFHTDDIFAVATLMMILGKDEDVEIVRTRDKILIEQGDYVVDVGLVYDPSKNRFDHHQPGGAGVRENGIPYASFGLVWKEYGKKLAGSKEVQDIIEQRLVLFVDALDNGVSIAKPIYEGVRPYDISDYFYSFWLDEETEAVEVDRIFKRNVSLAKDLLNREIEKISRIIKEGKIVESIYDKTEDKRIVVLDKHLAWGKVLTDKPEPLIVVYPTTDGTKWNAKAVRKDFSSFESRIQFPESWAGKEGKELQEASGVSDAVFCHRGRFLAVAETKKGALALAEKALNA